MAAVHLLTGPDLRQTTVACGCRHPEQGTWHRALVTCAACRQAVRRRRTRDLVGSRERDLQELVRQVCGQCGWMYYHTHCSRHSPSGFVDTVAVRGPRLIAAELKREGQEPTPEQQRWLEAFRQVQQVETYLWRPGDLPSILEILR